MKALDWNIHGFGFHFVVSISFDIVSEVGQRYHLQLFMQKLLFGKALQFETKKKTAE